MKKFQKPGDILLGNLCCFLAYFIFGFNIVFCKNIADAQVVSPIALFCMRSIGALVLFCMASGISRTASRTHGYKPDGKMQIERQDLWKIAVASFFGLFLTQLSFLKAVTMTTAVDVSILSVLSPIMTMIVAAIFLKDRITLKGVAGLAISVCGVMFLILNTVRAASDVTQTSIWGIVLMIVNTLSFALYVGIFKPLIQKYNVAVFMKWMFLFSTLFALPFGIKDLLHTDYAAINTSITLQILYVVVFATFVSYFLIPIGQKRIKPVVVCMYSYLQPIMAMAISLAAGMDTMTWAKAAACVLVFAGVGIVNFSRNQ